MFADDTKWGRCVDTAEETDKFQEDINRLEAWSRTWQMQFNTIKCKVIHLGRRGNPGCVYMIGDAVLEKTCAEKDIEVMVPRQQPRPMQYLLGQISRAVLYRDSNTFIRLYIVYVRPVLEYYIQAVGP